MKLQNLLLFCVIILMVYGCEESVNTPKPRGFPKVVFPEKEYQKFQEGYCHFTFDYPKYAQIVQDTNYFDEKPLNDCWFDIYVPKLSARVHCCYYALDKVNTLEKLRGDAFDLANKHNVKADYIDEMKIQKPNHVSGFVFDIEGAAASPFQFYLTDSTHHYLRGSLYFYTQARPDSLAPALEFMKRDVMQMINTFEWEKRK
jgi:gliding motility-associated lipoprotein GldD